ncbi:MAG TPA: aldo/keto reductase [Chthonomonadales bacterium]|nr:aldo/keto reductase [Chthonomonadales bacterium]
MQYREYGKTGALLSIVGFGGIVVTGAPQPEADRSVREAIDRGVNYFDVAPTYGDAEEKLGPALDGMRDQLFLACKTAKREKAEAAEELRSSLKKLRTDRFDLYQLHAVSSVQEAQRCLAPGGALEAIVEARDAGSIRYIGFSAHSEEAALLLMEQWPFASALFPFNYTMYYQGKFGPQVLENAQARGIARLALKSMARQAWPENADKSVAPNAWYEPQTDPAVAELSLRWTLTLPITAAIPPGDPKLFRMAMDFADRFSPLSENEIESLRQDAKRLKPLFTRAA